MLVLLAACAGALSRAQPSAEQATLATPQALRYFDAMISAHSATGVEQAACVSAWSMRVSGGHSTLTVERVRPAEHVRDAHATGVTFDCLASEGTVHTHSIYCVPSEIDKQGNEVFGIVVCPNPTRFAAFAVRP